jgi:hypothetical protein
MKIEKCYSSWCDDVYCFVVCCNMELNILRLKDIEKMTKKCVYLFDIDDNKTFDLIENLQKDFQEKFTDLCNDYEEKYLKMVQKSCHNTSIKKRKYPEKAGNEK